MSRPRTTWIPVPLSDPAPRGLYGPCVDRRVTQPTTFNVDGVDYTLSMSFLDPNGNPVSEFITREGGTINTSGLVGQFTPPPGTPVLTVDEVGPGDDEAGGVGRLRHRRAEHGIVAAFNVTLVDRLPNGPTGGMCDHDAASAERARFRGRRRDAGTG